MAKEAEVAQKFLAEVLNHKEVGCSRTSTSRSTAWASMKSFRAKDGSDEPPAGGRNGERDDLGQRPDATKRQIFLSTYTDVGVVPFSVRSWRRSWRHCYARSVLTLSVKLQPSKPASSGFAMEYVGAWAGRV
jgi:hypothetical protein